MKYSYIPPAPVEKFVFGSPKLAWFWLLVRLYVGLAWLTAGWGKFGEAAWTGDQAGQSVAGFVSRSLTKASGEHPDVQGWYAWFLQEVVLPNAEVFSYLVVYGEILVGIALIAGAFVGISAFFGLVMNLSFLLAGTVSTNPVLLTLSILLILAWRVAGYIGLDRYLLRWLGTPWQPGMLVSGKEKI